MQPLKNKLPRSDDFLFVFYDFEPTHNTKFSDKAHVYVPVLICLQQFCTVCEMQDDIGIDCERCGRRRHCFFKDPVVCLLSCLCETPPWCKKVVAIAHKAKAFDSQLILNRAIFLKLNPEIILNWENYQHANAAPAFFRLSFLLAYAFL
jgi:hypothetical protein